MPINKETPESKANFETRFQKGNGPNAAKWSEVENTFADLEEQFGFVPTFINNIAESSLPGAWQEAKALRFGTNTALDPKLKGLIGLAVAAQIPCDLISYFDQKATIVDGASQQEQLEAVMMAAMTRHWSTVLNGSLQDKDEFKAEADRVMTNAKKMMESFRTNMPAEEMFLTKPSTAEEAYKDIEKTLGLVPKFFLQFPKDAVAGAWSEFKSFQLNPYTALNGKQKELVGLAVAAQIPCEYCIYFHRNAARLNGASEQEMLEAIALAALTRHWSTIFHGPQMGFESFKKDADQMIGSEERYLQS